MTYSITLPVSSNVFLQIHFGSFSCVHGRTDWAILLEDNDFSFYSLLGQTTQRLVEKKNHFTLQFNLTWVVQCNNMLAVLKIVNDLQSSGKDV